MLQESLAAGQMIFQHWQSASLEFANWYAESSEMMACLFLSSRRPTRCKHVLQMCWVMRVMLQ